MNDYINLPLKERLIFKGYTLLITTITPTIITGINKIILKWKLWIL